MKNSEMKVSALLKSKSETEEEINRLNTVIKSLNGNLQDCNNFKDCGTVGIYSHSSEFRFFATKEVMLKAANEMLDIQRKELEPIVKKLEAIELMLNS